MKLLSMMKFQLKNVLPWLLAFYVIMFFQLFLSGVNANALFGIPLGNAVIFSFFIGLFSFRQNFRMALAQGVSRKLMFLGSSLMLMFLSILTAFFSAGSSLLLLVKASERYGDYRSPVYMPDLVPSFQKQIPSVLPWLIGFCISAVFLGYLIAILFYYWRGFSAFARMTWIVSGLLILYLLFGTYLSIIGTLLISMLFGLADSFSWNIDFIYIFFAFSSLLLTAASWLLIRRATITTPSPATATRQAD